MRNTLQLGLVVALVLALTGCFGFLKPEDAKLEQLELTAGAEVVEPGESVTLTVVGKDAKGKNVVIEPTADNWSWEPENAGTLTVDEADPKRAEFTASAEFEGEVTVKVIYEELEAEVSFNVAEVEILGVKACDYVDQGPGDYEQNYTNAQQTDDNNGVRKRENDERGYKALTWFSHWNWPGHWIQWEIEVAEAGDYALVMRYATKEVPPYTDRWLKINDEEIHGADNPIEFPSTGGFGDSPEQWGFVVVPVNIKEPGTIDLILTHAGPEGERKGLNLAYLALVSPANVTVDEAFLLKIEEAIGVERMEGFWN